MSAASDSSVKVVASPQVSYALILALIGAYGGGAWFLATQAANQATMNDRMNYNKVEMDKSIALSMAALTQRMLDGDAAMNDRMTRFVGAFGTRLDNLDKNNEQRGAAVSALDARMARIESKLDFLMQNIKSGSGR